jgi:hypothetical protein
MGTTRERHPHRGHRTGRPSGARTGRLAAVVVVAGCAAVACGSTPQAAVPAPPPPPQACVQAVFTALSGMITEPRQDQPFADLVARYGTSSPAYTAYQDSFGEFYGQAVAHGIHAAEDDVRTTVTRDCATAG